jgi:hypothetical protein
MRQFAAATRARWMAELYSALEEAGRLVEEVMAHRDADDLLDLVLRIEAARLEIRDLQLRGRAIPVNFSPDWSHSPEGDDLTDLMRPTN